MKKYYCIIFMFSDNMPALFRELEEIIYSTVVQFLWIEIDQRYLGCIKTQAVVVYFTSNIQKTEVSVGRTLSAAVTETSTINCDTGLSD